MTKGCTKRDMKMDSTMATGKARENTKQPTIDFDAAAAKAHMKKFAYSGKATFAKLVTPDNPYPVDLLKYAISRR